MLKLTFKWQFDDIRDLAVEQLKQEDVASLVEQNVLARVYQMEEWLMQARVKFCLKKKKSDSQRSKGARDR